jgi:membrane protein YdbS with pleckstrin-like domain
MSKITLLSRKEVKNLIYSIIYIIIALTTTGLLYWFLYDNNDSEIISIFGGIVFPLTIIILLFSLPVLCVNKIKQRKS